LTRSFDQLATRAEMTAALAMETVVEFGPRLAVADLPTAVAAIRHVRKPNCRLLIDTMHLVRSGSGAAAMACPFKPVCSPSRELVVLSQEMQLYS
jgi:sugar phosphate isomerase/epimerase